jgi:hypothetical protein
MAMSGGSKPPPAPDPYATAAAATKSNKDTALYNYQLNANNTTDQFGGSKSYKQVGTWPDGTPKFEATQSLGGPSQQLYNTASSNLQNSLSQPFNLNNESTEARLMELGRARLDPVFQQRQGSLESQLLNSGYQRGSDAWNRQMDQFSRQQNDAYNQLLLTGRGQAVDELMKQRAMPMQEYTSLTSSAPFGGNQVQTPQVSAQPTDVAGIVNNNYANQMAAYNAENSQNNAMMGGLFGLGGTVLGGLAGGPLGGTVGGQLGGYFGKKFA